MTTALHKILFDKYDLYKEESISSERIKYNDIYPLVQKFKKHSLFEFDVPGKSIEGREINLISFGSGPVKVMAWTQMHGDEPTATSAVFDVLNFFAADDELNSLRELILSGITLYLIPMLNPDGAERHQRENFLNIDLNRDALKLETPEAKILFETAQRIKPDFAFNLHDQNSYYTTGRTNKTAAISLLAPPFNYDKEINTTRKKSMQVIGFLFDILSDFIPGHIARYNDDFEQRAFGDNFIKSGISSILIESGFINGDLKKSYLRKLNFIALISAFKCVVDKSYESIITEKYYSIPENESLLFDLLLKNLSIEIKGKSYKIDIGINREKIFNETFGSFYFRSNIEQIGDLSIYYGIEEHDFSGFSVNIPKVFNSKIEYDNISEINFNSLHADGIAFLELTGEINAGSYINFPINIIERQGRFVQKLRSGEPANLVLIKDGEIKYIIINGFLSDITDTNNSIHNGLVID